MKRLFVLFCLINFSFWLEPNSGFAHPAATLYDEAVNLINLNKLSDARKKFQEVQLMHPFSSFATQAQLMSSFISYINHDYIMSALDCEKYIEMYSNSVEIDYVRYLYAMSHYKQISSVERDSTAAINALNAFKQVTDSTLDNNYAKEAKIKQNEILNHLAAKEIKIGIFYFNKGDYPSAIHRFQNVISNYNNTDYVQEANYRLSEIFHLLSLTREEEYYTNKLN